MNETFQSLSGMAQEAMRDAMGQASAELDTLTDEKNDWRAEVIRLRELLWHLCPTGKPACPHCHGAGRVLIPWRPPEGVTPPCLACQGQGWQAIGDVEGAGLRPLAQAGADDDTWSPV